MDSILSAPYFHNEEAAYAFVEARLWPRGSTDLYNSPIVRHSDGQPRAEMNSSSITWHLRP
jgi:hypothetical protein